MLTSGYVHGASATQLIGETIGAFFDQAAERWSNREAPVVRHQSIRWTYTELKQQVDAFAAGLLALGLAPGDRVGIWSPNNAEWVVAQFATAKAGMILVNINPAYRISELEYALNKVGCAALITAPAFKTSNYIDMLVTLMPEIPTSVAGALAAERVPLLRTLICLGADVPGFKRFDTVPEQGTTAHARQLAELAATLQFDDPISIQFTSGTTGAPKGATLSHHNILNNGFFQGEAMGMTADDRYCVPLPMYHCGGMVNGTLACLTHGSCMVLLSEWFDPLATLEAIEEELCTVLSGVPTMFIAQLNHPRFAAFDLSSLRPAGWGQRGAVGRIARQSQVFIRQGRGRMSPCRTCTAPRPVRSARWRHGCGVRGSGVARCSGGSPARSREASSCKAAPKGPPSSSA